MSDWSSPRWKKVKLFNSSGVDPTNLFFLHKRLNFLFFAVSLGHFVVNRFFFICYKHSNLTKPKNWTMKKKKVLKDQLLVGFVTFDLKSYQMLLRVEYIRISFHFSFHIYEPVLSSTSSFTWFVLDLTLNLERSSQDEQRSAALLKPSFLQSSALSFESPSPDVPTKTWATWERSGRFITKTRDKIKYSTILTWSLAVLYL